MKNWLTYLVVVALVAMNISSLHHMEECQNGDENAQIATHIEDVHSHGHNHQPSEQETAECDDCVDSHHHHSYASILSGKAETIVSGGKMLHRWAGEHYLSSLIYPPSKPPKA